MNARGKTLTRQLVVRAEADLDDWLQQCSDEAGRTKAQTTRWMLRLIKDHGLPAPTNADRQTGASRFEVDQTGDVTTRQARHTVVGDDVNPVGASPVELCYADSGDWSR